MDFDGAWDAWLGAGHGDHGGFLYDQGRDVIRCACGEEIPAGPVPGWRDAERDGTYSVGPGAGWMASVPAVPAAAGTEHMPDPAPGYEWQREPTEDTA